MSSTTDDTTDEALARLTEAIMHLRAMVYALADEMRNQKPGTTARRVERARR